MTTAEPSIVEQIASILTAIATFTAIGTAIYGINAWRREHVGKRRIELAEDALALFYEAADAIDAIRHPLSTSDETASLERGPEETERQFEARRNASVVFFRYNQNRELFSRLHAMRYRFMAQIGREEARPFEEIRSVLNRVVLSARMLSRLWARDNFQSEEHREKHFEEIAQHEAVFWAGLSDQDQIAAKVRTTIEELEGTCAKVIGRSSSMLRRSSKRA